MKVEGGVMLEWREERRGVLVAASAIHDDGDPFEYRVVALRLGTWELRGDAEIVPRPFERFDSVPEAQHRAQELEFETVDAAFREWEEEA